MELSRNTILVTGGGSGIGRGLASAFHQADDTVIIAGRRREVLEAVAAEHPGMVAMPLDVGDAQAIANFAQRIAAEHPALNVLVNNAGIMASEARIEPAVAESLITTNLLGPLRLTSALLPHLLACPRAAILNVSSTLAFVPFVRTPTYCGRGLLKGQQLDPFYRGEPRFHNRSAADRVVLAPAADRRDRHPRIPQHGRRLLAVHAVRDAPRIDRLSAVERYPLCRRRARRRRLHADLPQIAPHLGSR